MADGRRIREEKRRRFEAKQQRRAGEGGGKNNARTRWLEQNSAFATVVAEADVTPASPLAALLAPYFDIRKEKSTEAPSSGRRSGRGEEEEEEGQEATRPRRLFIAEGTETVRLLIQQSGRARSDGTDALVVISIFSKPSVFFDPPVRLLGDVEEALARTPASNEPSPGFHVLVASEAVLSRVAGFPIARGALACGVVPEDRDEAWLRRFVRERLARDGRVRLLALDGIGDAANLGAMLRCASAFGVGAVVLSAACCDAWSRRSVRVSMGHVCRVPIVRVRDLAAEVRALAAARVRAYAAVLDAARLLADVDRGGVPAAWCCVFGNEGHGISERVAEACAERIRIDIADGVDSLSVPVACGILLNGLKERERRPATTCNAN